MDIISYIIIAYIMFSIFIVIGYFYLYYKFLFAKTQEEYDKFNYYISLYIVIAANIHTLISICLIIYFTTDFIITENDLTKSINNMKKILGPLAYERTGGTGETGDASIIDNIGICIA
jgi:hypothetical protein